MNKRKDINEVDYKKDSKTDKFMITKGERDKEINYQFGINRYTLFYIKQM